MLRPKFHGTNVVFWVGVVEERDDSTSDDGLKLGRMRVRVLGYHSEKKTEDNEKGEGIPTNKLHWAYPVSPLTSASMNGIGQSPTGVVEGTWVFGFAMDGQAMQDLYVFGTLVGVAEERLSPSDQGFCDPNDKYPKDDYLNESDVNRLARADKLTDTIVQDKKDGRVESVRKAKAGTWSEPSVPYAATYPFNHVRESETGHIEEWDDTDGAERLHLYHRKGTFREWHPDGSEVRKVVGDGYEIHLKDRNMLVKGELSITVEGDAKIYSKKNIYLEADKNIDMKAGGKITMYAKKGIDMDTPKKVNIFGAYGVAIKATNGAISASTSASMSLKASSIGASAKTVSITGVTTASMTSAGFATVSGAKNQGSGVAKAVG